MSLPKPEAVACGRVLTRLFRKARTTAYRFVAEYADHEYHLGTIMRYRRGERVPDPFVLRHLCSFLGTTIEEFMDQAERELTKLRGQQ